MEITKAGPEHFEIIKEIVITTIKDIYPEYYPQGAVDFFLSHHSDSQIRITLKEAHVLLLSDGGVFAATGTCQENRISRLFVLPRFQSRGYGSALMNALEEHVFGGGYEQAILEASLPAFDMYIKRGYLPAEYHKIKTKNGNYLCYHVMTKARPQN